MKRQNVGHTTTQKPRDSKGHFTQWSPVKPSSTLGQQFILQPNTTKDESSYLLRPSLFTNQRNNEDRKRSELNHAAAHSTAKRKRRSPGRSSDTVWYSGAASCAKRDAGELPSREVMVGGSNWAEVICAALFGKQNIQYF